MEQDNNTHIVIMAGGIGSRFWPMSTPDYPKQFIDVMGVGKSLIQLAVERFSSLCPLSNFWVVTSEQFVGIVQQQLPEIPLDNILAEPEARNTAPCIAYACWKIKCRFPNANIVVTPSDALVIDVIGFRKVIAQALSFTQERKAIVTIGVKPSRPETGYGYIKTFSSSIKNEVVKVEAFKEKPNRKVAEDYLADGHYFWNVGIFVWHVDMIMEAIRKYTPELARVMDNMSLSFYTDDEKRVIGELFPTCEKISIDYAVMEKAKEVYMLSAEFGWSDLGSWGSLHSLLPQDMDGNSAVGSEVRMIDCAGCVVHTSDERKVVIEGLKDYIVAEKNGQLLICRLRNEQMIKEWGR